MNNKIITKIVTKQEFNKIKDMCTENKIKMWNIANVNELSSTIIAYVKDKNGERPIGFINANRFSLDVDYNDIDTDFHENLDNSELLKNKGDIQVEFDSDPFNSYVYIDLVYVNPQYRWKGVGTMLYKALEEELTEMDCIYESRRSINGSKACLLKHIQKCMTFEYHEYEDMIMNMG